jgi:tRNA (adenine57-N1/adenine58-N1)-methyltransferase
MFLHAPLLLEQEEARRQHAEEQQVDASAASAEEAPPPPPAGPRRIEAGDMVIVYENINSAKFVYVERDGFFRNRYGTFRYNVSCGRHALAVGVGGRTRAHTRPPPLTSPPTAPPTQDWIGTPFGSRVTAYSTAGAAGPRGGGGNNNRRGGSKSRGATPAAGGEDATTTNANGSSTTTQGGFVYLLAPTPELWTIVLRHRTQILYLADISLVVSELELKPGSVVLEAGTGSGSLTHALARAVAPHGRVASFEFHPARAAEATDELKRHGLLPDIASVTLRDVEAEGFPGEENPAEGGFFVADSSADAVFLDLPGPWRVVPAAARVLRPGGRFCGFSPCMEQVQRTAAALDARGFRDVRTVEVLLRAYDVHSVSTMAVEGEGGGEGAGVGDEGAAAAAGAAGGGGNGAAPAASAGTAADGSAPPLPARKRARTAGDEGGQADAAAAAGATAPTHRRVLCWPQSDARGHTGYLTFATKYLSAEGDGEEEAAAEEEEEEEDDDEEEAAVEEDDDGGGQRMKS